MQNPFNQSPAAFPILECVHIAGIVCGVGTAGLVSLRLLGVGLKRKTPAEVWKPTQLWTHLGLTIAILSGLLLFSVDPQQYAAINAFRIKMVLLLLALVFYFTAVRSAAKRGSGTTAAYVSLALWASVPFGGVFIAFTETLNGLASWSYPLLLGLHIASLILLGGLILATDLRLLGIALRDESIPEIAKNFRAPKRWTFVIAAVTGLALFAAKAGESSLVYGTWFWIKLGLLALVAANYFALRKGVFSGANPERARVAAGSSLVLAVALIAFARGPATVKDIMHSMVDPSGDYLFQSVQTIADHSGVHEIAPHTDADWENLRERVNVLMSAPDVLGGAGRMAAQPKDRSKNPEVENEPWQVQKLLNEQHDEFIRRAVRLRDAASLAMHAVDTKDPAALLVSLDRIDKACESCHLHYWYPNDQNAREAARADGVQD